jgi:hypothetical protein
VEHLERALRRLLARLDAGLIVRVHVDELRVDSDRALEQRDERTERSRGRIGHRDRDRGATAIGERARRLAETKYSYEAYLEKTRQACAALMPDTPPMTAVKDVA